MKQNITLGNLLLAAAVALGIATAAPAQTTPAATSPTEPAAAAMTPSANGLLGSTYVGAAYDYFALHEAGPNHAQGFSVDYNQPWTSNFDLNLDYDWSRANEPAGRLTQLGFNLGGTAYANLGWGKPFALAAAGWDWDRGADLRDHSFHYKVGVGVELPVTGAITLSPLVDFVRATHFNQNEVDFGAKLEYRVTRAWGLLARAQYDSMHHASDQAEYSLGVNYHF